VRSTRDGGGELARGYAARPPLRSGSSPLPGNAQNRRGDSVTRAILALALRAPSPKRSRRFGRLTRAVRPCRFLRPTACTCTLFQVLCFCFCADCRTQRPGKSNGLRCSLVRALRSAARARRLPALKQPRRGTNRVSLAAANRPRQSVGILPWTAFGVLAASLLRQKPNLPASRK